MSSDTPLLWRSFLAHGGLAALIGPPIGGFVFWLGMMIKYIADASESAPPFSGMLSMLIAFMVFSYLIGFFPALLAGVIYRLLRIGKPDFSTLRSLGMGALSGLLAAFAYILFSLLIGVMNFSDFVHPGSLMVIAVSTTSGFITGYVLNGLLK